MIGTLSTPGESRWSSIYEPIHGGLLLDEALRHNWQAGWAGSWTDEGKGIWLCGFEGRTAVQCDGGGIGRRELVGIAT